MPAAIRRLISAVRRGGHHRHAEVDRPAHLLGVGEHRLEALREQLGDLLDVDADVGLGLVEDELARCRWAP